MPKPSDTMSFLTTARRREVDPTEVHHLRHLNHFYYLSQVAILDPRKEIVMAQLMQVRQAAQALGVHENTIRRWEQRGLLQAVRLPSGVRRFRPEDIEQMCAQMFSGFAPLRADDDVTPVRARSVD
jgi:excisionase family DNA binding protein